MPASPMIEQLLAALWRASWQASLLILLVLLAHMALRRRLSPGWRSALWLLVLLRLALPVTPSSHWSLFNLANRLDTHLPAGLDPTSAIDTQAHRSAGLRHGGDVGDRMPLDMAPDSFDLPDIRLLSEAAWTEVAGGASLPATESTVVLRRPAANIARNGSSIVFWIWLGGAALLAGRIVYGAGLLARRIRTGVKVTDPRTLELLEESRRKMGMHRAPSLVQTHAVDSPALFGLLRPKLLLPPGLVRRLNDSELRHVFLHELAHLRRHDVLLNWIATLLQTLHWFNPIVWFAMARMRADRELACDALALARSDAVERRAYGATLLKLVSGLTGVRPVAGLVGISEGNSQLKSRIRSIASYRRPDRSSMFAGAVLLLVLAAVNLTDARANRDAESPENAPNESATEKVETYTPGANTAQPEPEPMPAEPRQSEPEADDTSSAVPGAAAPPSPNPMATTNLIHPGPGRLTIQSKLDRIILNEIEFDGLVLPEVLNHLGTVAREQDPDQEGINFLINPNVMVSRAAPLVDPKTGQITQAQQAEPLDIRSVIIRITPALHNVPLGDVIEAITHAADQPIRYSIEEYGIIFSHEPPDASVQLETRVFKVNPNTFLEGLYAMGTFPLGDVVSQGQQGGAGSGGLGGSGGSAGGGLPGITATNLPQNIQQVVRDFFTATGVNVFPPNQIYHSDRKGVLMVRATSAELDVIQQAIEVLHEPPPQITSEPWGVEDIVPEPPRSEPAPDSDAAHHRRSVESRLNNIVLGEIELDSIPLWKAVRQLEAESILQDPEGQGVRMYLDQPPNALFENPVDPATRRLRAWFDLESIVIRIMPPIRNVRLGDVLEAITRVADQPIQYSIVGPGIVFSRKPPEEAARLETRIFKVGNRFEESLRRIPTLPRVLEFEDRRTDGPAGVASTNATEETEDFGATLRKFLLAAGVSPWPPNQVYFGDRKGVLMVRATTQELDSLQMALELLAGPQPKVKLKVRAVELTRTESREMGFDWFLGSTTAQPNGPGVASQVMGILTERQFPVVVGALEGRRNTSTQAVMVVTVQSGLQVRISWASGDGTPLTLDCLPVVGSDEAGLDLVDLTMTLVPGETEPVALDKPDATAAAQSSEDVITRRAMVWTGQTVVLGRPMTAEFEQGIPGSGPSRKQLFVFVTSTILEPTGADPPRHHFFDPDTIPPQD